MKSKRYINYLVLLILPALACSTQLTKPVENLKADLIAETAIPSPTLLSATAEATARSETCEVIADEALNLRDTPGIDGTVIAWLKSGDELKIVSGTAAGNWLKVQTADGLTGYINSTFCERK